MHQQHFRKSNNKEIKLHYWKGHKNFGDELSAYLIERISNRPVVYAKSKETEKVVAIGSLMSNDVLVSGSIVWGTGALNRKSLISKKIPLLSIGRKIKDLFRKKLPPKLCAVRGPLTRQMLLEHGYQCPEIYGDPAILLPDFYSPKPPKKQNPLGIILHQTHQRLVNESVFNHLGVKYISINREGDTAIERFVDEVVSCEKIFSTSLHGVIVAQAYGIPAQWIRIAGTPIHADENLKFADYFLGSNQINQDPITLKDLSEDEVSFLLTIKPPCIREFTNKRGLLAAFPFNII